MSASNSRRQPGRVVQCADGRIGRTLHSDPIVNGKICVYLFPESVLTALNKATTNAGVTDAMIEAKQATTDIAHEWALNHPDNEFLYHCSICFTERWTDGNAKKLGYGTGLLYRRLGGEWSEESPRCRPRDPEKRLCDPATLKSIGMID